MERQRVVVDSGWNYSEQHMVMRNLDDEDIYTGFTTPTNREEPAEASGTQVTKEGI